MTAQVIAFPTPQVAAPPRSKKTRRPVDDLQAIDYMKIPPVPGLRTQDAIGVRISGDSLNGDGIFDGDVLVLNTRFGPLNIKDGDLVAVNTSSGILVKHWHKGKDGTVVLKSSNSLYDDLCYQRDEVEIIGLPVCHIGYFGKTPGKG